MTAAPPDKGHALLWTLRNGHKVAAWLRRNTRQAQRTCNLADLLNFAADSHMLKGHTLPNKPTTGSLDAPLMHVALLGARQRGDYCAP
jgi:hypothetical protein